MSTNIISHSDLNSLLGSSAPIPPSPADERLDREISPLMPPEILGRSVVRLSPYRIPSPQDLNWAPIHAIKITEAGSPSPICPLIGRIWMTANPNGSEPLVLIEDFTADGEVTIAPASYFEMLQEAWNGVVLCDGDKYPVARIFRTPSFEFRHQDYWWLTDGLVDAMWRIAPEDGIESQGAIHPNQVFMEALEVAEMLSASTKG